MPWYHGVMLDSLDAEEVDMVDVVSLPI